MTRIAPFSVHHAQQHHRLDQLDVQAFHVFAVCSPLFWKTRRQLAVDFFEDLQRVQTAGFLVGRSLEVCSDASRLNIVCVLGNNFTARQDPMGMMERWHVILHFLLRGQRIIFAGLDVRFTRPVHNMYAAAHAPDAAIDVAFEASVWWEWKIVKQFTPDIVVAFPTEKMMNFVTAVLSRYNEHLYDGLPSALRVRKLRRHMTRLKGPAQQDMLFDVLLSTLYNRHVAVRKVGLAQNFLCCQAKLERKLSGTRKHMSSPVDANGDSLATQAASCVCRRGINSDEDVMARRRLGALPMMRTSYGTLLRTPYLTMLAADGKLTMSMHHLAENHHETDICAICSAWNGYANSTYAIHCQGKSPSCLNFDRCKCLRKPNRLRKSG